MTLYFMNLRDRTEELLDPEGREYGSMDELRTAVFLTVLDLMSDDIKRGVVDLRFRIDAEDKNGLIVYTLPFKQAVRIILDTAEEA